MSARPAVPLFAGAAVVLAIVLVALAQSASSATGATRALPSTREAAPPHARPARAPVLSDAVVSGPVRQMLSVKRYGQWGGTARATPRVLPTGQSRRRSGQPPHSIVVVRGTLALRSRPGGPIDARLRPRTEFGSPRVLGVAKRKGRWLGLVTSARPNGRLAWADRRDRALGLRRTGWSLHADLSERRVELRRFGRVVRRLRVAIGRPGSPTPTGRFAVTDKLRGARFGAYYGCCILALSGYQEHLPPGWRGGNRIAIHGTDVPGAIGTAASAGCLRAADADLAALMRRVPLGAPVLIRS